MTLTPIFKQIKFYMSYHPNCKLQSLETKEAEEKSRAVNSNEKKNGGEFQLVCLLCLSQSFFGGDQSPHLFFILSLTRLLLHSLVLSPYFPVCPHIALLQQRLGLTLFCFQIVTKTSPSSCRPLPKPQDLWEVLQWYSNTK